MSDFLNRITILDEIIDFLSEKNNISLDETHNSKIQEIFNDNSLFEINWEKEAAKLDGPEDVNLPAASKKAVQDAAKEAEAGELKPDPNAAKMVQDTESAFAKSMRKHGVVGTAAKPLLGVVDKGLKFLFGSGVFDDPRDANPLMMQINRNPYLAPYYLSAQLAMLSRSMGDGRLSQMSNVLSQQMDDAGDNIVAAAEKEAGSEGSEFAVPVFKKFSGDQQKAGAPPRSLASQLAKLFPEVPKSAISQILKDLSKQLKAQDINIQENKNIISKTLLSHMIYEGRLSRGEVTADEVANLRAGDLLKKTDAILKGLKNPNDIKRFKAAVKAGKSPSADIELNRKAALKIQNYYTNHGGKGLLDAKLSAVSQKKYAPADLKMRQGQINTRQSVGPQLKAAGIDIKSPEGKVLQKKILKVIRRFLNKNLERLGKQDIKVISEIIDEVMGIKENIPSDDFERFADRSGYEDERVPGKTAHQRKRAELPPEEPKYDDSHLRDLGFLEEGDDYPAPHKMKKLVGQAKMDGRYKEDDPEKLKKAYDKHVRGTLRDPKHSEAHKK